MSILGVALVAAGLSAEIRPADAAVENASKDAIYSTGKSGSRLKWLPHQPKSSDNGSKVVTTQYAQPFPTTPPKKADEPEKPTNSRLFSDPFGDRKPAAGADAPPTMPEEPQPASPLPGAGQIGPNGQQIPYTPPGGFPEFNNQQKPSKGAFKSPTLEESLAAGRVDLRESCPSPDDLKDIADLTTDITPSPGDLPKECPLGNQVFMPRSFAPMTYTWTASGLCHKPLYFEDVQLERYGHMAGPWLQPFASGAHFFLTFPILPYKMGLELPNECMYTLGYYRPGSCAPYLFDPIPLSVRAALFEAGGVVGLSYIIP